ncbi:MAG: glycosyltransferase [Bacilli bacterium]|nr:glycosyltransferase [Bacilli bacterium]
MKVLIDYIPKNELASFEGNRMRKDLKGQCEVLSVPWVASVQDRPDVAHFLSPRELKHALQAQGLGAKIVVSAFYCENDAGSSFLDYGKKDGVLRKDALKLLGLADLIFVPSAYHKKLLEEKGIDKRIEVEMPVVNFDRFVSLPSESEIFMRYFRISPRDNFVLSTGNYHDKKATSSIIEIARHAPNVKFFFFGAANGNDRIGYYFLRNKAPSNLRFELLTEDDVYRSGLIHAGAFLLMSERSSPVSILEAFATRSQVVALGDQTQNPILENGMNSFIFKDAKSAGEYLDNVYLESSKRTIMHAYGSVQQYGLRSQATKLIGYYNSLFESK